MMVRLSHVNDLGSPLPEDQCDRGRGGLAYATVRSGSTTPYAKAQRFPGLGRGVAERGVMTKLSSSVVGVAVLLLASVVALAQPKVGLQQVAAGMKGNQEALRDYAWQSRVSVEVDGEAKKVDLYQVRYDLDGNLQKTRMGGEADPKKVRGPIRKQKTKKKKKQASEFAAEVKEQLQACMAPDALMTAGVGPRHIERPFSIGANVLISRSTLFGNDGGGSNCGVRNMAVPPVTVGSTFWGAPGVPGADPADDTARRGGHEQIPLQDLVALAVFGGGEVVRVVELALEFGSQDRGLLCRRSYREATPSARLVRG